MKRALSLLLLSCAALSAQVTVNVGSVTVPNEVSTAIETWRLGQYADPASPITLTGGITAGATTGTVSSAVGVSVGDQLVIDMEALNVAAINGNVVTWTRGASVTTAASHANGAVVHIARYRSAVALMRAMIRAEVNAILAQQPSATLQTQLENKATADAAIKAFLDSSVQ
jgi:hypothetical protein